MRICYVPCDSTIKKEKDLWREWSSWKARCSCCTFSLVHGSKEICCLNLKSTRLFRKMDTHADSGILSLMYCLPRERQIPTDTVESGENTEHILGPRFKFMIWIVVQIIVVQHFLEDFLQPFSCGALSEGLTPHRRPYNPGLLTSSAKLQHSFLLPFRSSLTMLIFNCLSLHSLLQWKTEVRNPSSFKMSEWCVSRWLSTELHSKELTD